jgi:SpoIIAA-like
MQNAQVHDDNFLKVLWDENARIIRIDWKEATSSMTDEDFKATLTLFAGHVERKKARGILVDVSRFRHKPGPEVMPWRVKNISNRYAAAGVKRQAFLFPKGAQMPPMRSSPEEKFLTETFDDVEKAEAWLTAG